MGQEISKYLTTGRRKEAVARVWLFTGTGNILVNKKPLKDYFPRLALQTMITEPLNITNRLGKYDISAKVSGGGLSGQAGALRHGIARALVQAESELRPILRKTGCLTRDPRMKERKKYGQKGARKRFQWTKR